MKSVAVACSVLCLRLLLCSRGAAAEELLKAGLTDSKKLSAKRRAALVPVIQSLCVASGLGQASAREIDACGIRVATERAMLRALQRLPQRPGLVLVDGNLPLRLWQGPQRTVIAGDSRSAAIAAASVLAKEARDALIRRLSARFPWLRPRAPCGLRHGATSSELDGLRPHAPASAHVLEASARLSLARRFPGTSCGSRRSVAGQPGL